MTGEPRSGTRSGADVDTDTGEGTTAGSGMHGVSTLTSGGGDESGRVVLHVDCDCFYAACERLREPALAGEPVVIGMGYAEDDVSGAVATASYEAREYGVESAMPIGDALDKLPRMVDADEGSGGSGVDSAGYYRPVDIEYYESVGDDVQSVLAEFADTFEPVSIDEAYLDVTTQTEWASVTEFAETVKARVYEETGIPVSIGVAPTKSAAKVASDFDKPDGLVVVEPGEVREFFAPLDIELVHGIGPVTASQLREMGVETAGDLAVTDPDVLVDAFGERGKEAHQRARGHDPRDVTPPDDPKSISNESSLGDPTSDGGVVRETVRELIGEVTSRASEKGALYRTVGVKVVEPPFDVSTRARTLPGPVDNPELVESIVLELLGEFDGVVIRKVGVRVSNLTFSADEQPMLDEWVSDESSETSSGDGSTGSDRGSGGCHRSRSRQARMGEYTGSDTV